MYGVEKGDRDGRGGKNEMLASPGHPDTSSPCHALEGIVWNRSSGDRSAQELRRQRGAQGVNLEVNPGETITIIGPSGSGKTTLLRCINYLERPTSGHVYIEDRLIGERWNGETFRHVGDRELAKERTEMGMVFQRFNLWPHLTALDNVTLGPLRCLKQSADEARAEGEALLEKVGLGAQGGRVPGAPLRRAATAGGHRPRAGHAAEAALCSTSRPRRSIRS